MPGIAPTEAQIETGASVTPTFVKRIIPEGVVEWIVIVVRGAIESGEIPAIPRTAVSLIHKVAVHDNAVSLLGLVHRDFLIIRITLRVVILVVACAQLGVATRCKQHKAQKGGHPGRAEGACRAVRCLSHGSIG